MNISLFLELEQAVNAVEPRVWEGYNPGLTDEEIDTIMKNVSFELPDDLRALYKWRNGSKDGEWNGFLGNYISMLPLVQQWALTEESKTPFTAQDWSHRIKEDIKESYSGLAEAIPVELDSKEFMYLFDDGGDGATIVAALSPEQRINPWIYSFDPADYPRYLTLMFRGVEPMLRTACDWWHNGVFSPEEHRSGWRLKVDFDKKFDIARRLNPDCDYWTS